jgi:hypothetical protein
MFLHSADLGLAVVMRRFGAAIKNADGVEISSRTLLEQHLEEDFHFHPALDDWMDCARPPETQVTPEGRVVTRLGNGSLVRRSLPADVMPFLSDPCHTAAEKFGGEAKDYEVLRSFFDLPSRFSEHPQANAFLENSFGIFLAEEIIGPILSVSGGREIPTRIVAEKFVCVRRGSIPSPSTLAGSVVMQEWMIGTKDRSRHPRRLAL